MSLNAMGGLLVAILMAFAFTMTLPKLAFERDADANDFQAPINESVEHRDQARNTLAGRNTYRREPLGWKFTSPARLGIFRPCRGTDGAAVDADTDGLVDNLVPTSRWRTDWSAVDPAVTDPNFAALTPAAQEAARTRARGRTGLGSDFGRTAEPPQAGCDQQRSGIARGPFYARH